MNEKFHGLGKSVRETAGKTAAGFAKMTDGAKAARKKLVETGAAAKAADESLGGLEKGAGEAKETLAKLKKGSKGTLAGLGAEAAEAGEKLAGFGTEAREALDALQGDIQNAQKSFEELGAADVPSPEIRLAVEKLQEDFALAKERFDELSDVEPPSVEARLALDALESDMGAARAKIEGFEARLPPPDTGDAEKGVAGLVSFVKGKFAGMGESAAGEFAGMLQGMNKAIKAAPIVAAVMAIVASVRKLATGINRWLADGARAYQEHQRELQKMGAVLNATGAAAWTSARQLAAQADELARNSAFAQNEIMRMQSVLLGFRSVAGEVFGEATQAIADMASVLGKDLGAAACRAGARGSAGQPSGAEPPGHHLHRHAEANDRAVCRGRGHGFRAAGYSRRAGGVLRRRRLRDGERRERPEPRRDRA